MAEDTSTVLDVTPKMALESNDAVDITQQNVEESRDVTDVTQQNVGEQSTITDITHKTVVESSSVTGITPQKVEGSSAVIGITKQTVEESSSVTDVTQRTIEEQSIVTDDARQTLDEPSAETDITQITLEERSRITNAILPTNEEQNVVRDDALKTVELIANRDVTEQAIKEESIVRDTTQRKFGYVKVSWEIENFFFVTKNEEWEISSPEFDVEGFFVTRWRLILKVKKGNEGNNRDAFICLERLDGESDTRDIRVCWNVWYEIAGEELPLCDRENLIRSNFFLAVQIKNFELFERSLEPSLTTAICLKGLILVRCTDNGVNFKRPEDLGVKRLSEDISIVYSISQHQSDVIEYDSFSDLKINSEGYPLICHKPILSARNKALNETIDENSGRSEININFSRGKAGRKIFQYLYSGNLTHILRMPSISIDKAINYLSMDELKCYYLKDSINLHTRFEAEEIYVKWIVIDLNSEENFLFSPVFSRENSELAVRLRLGLNKDDPEATGLRLKFDVIEGNKISEFYFICGIANNNGQIVSRRAMQWASGCEAEIHNFASKSVLRNSCFTGNGHLTILCSIFIPKGTKYQSVVKTQKCLRPELDHERHYRLLSSQLNTLFETGKHTDLLIKCNGETFNVHKCVLFARSPVFRRAIRHMRYLQGKKSKGFTMHDFDPKILRIILHYIYSGILNCQKEDIFAIYEGSKTLSMVTLQNQLYEMLLNNLDASNAIETLELAVENTDFRLVESVCRFMRNNINEIKLQKSWDSFVQKKESLYLNLKKYARDHLNYCDN